LNSFQHILDQATSGLPPVMRHRLARHILAQIVCLGIGDSLIRPAADLS
jgi:hypothetical protein